jgi:uncharacterized protein (TIGR02145 family)
MIKVYKNGRRAGNSAALLCAAAVAALCCGCWNSFDDAVAEAIHKECSFSRAGSFTDSRDGQIYKTVNFGGCFTWMAENLNYQTDDSWCYYGNADSDCVKYGRSYTWDAAMKACPAGWHLPASGEWNMLTTAVAGGDETAGTALKSKPPDSDGTDDFGFSAMSGCWWTTWEDRSDRGAGYRCMSTGSAHVDGGDLDLSYSSRDKSSTLSVRCVQD